MATRKKKVILESRYDGVRRQELDDLKNRTTQEAEQELGLDSIAKNYRGFFGRKTFEYLLGRLDKKFVLDDEVDGLGHYQAHLNWFRVLKDKDGEPEIALKISVITVEKNGKKEVFNNTRPYYYDVMWSDNIIDAINDIFDKLEDAIYTAEAVDYGKLPKNLQG